MAISHAEEVNSFKDVCPSNPMKFSAWLRKFRNYCSIKGWQLFLESGLDIRDVVEIECRRRYPNEIQRMSIMLNVKKLFPNPRNPFSSQYYLAVPTKDIKFPDKEDEQVYQHLLVIVDELEKKFRSLMVTLYDCCGEFFGDILESKGDDPAGIIDALKARNLQDNSMGSSVIARDELNRVQMDMTGDMLSNLNKYASELQKHMKHVEDIEGTTFSDAEQIGLLMRGIPKDGYGKVLNERIQHVALLGQNTKFATIVNLLAHQVRTDEGITGISQSVPEPPAAFNVSDPKNGKEMAFNTSDANKNGKDKSNWKLPKEQYNGDNRQKRYGGKWKEKGRNNRFNNRHRGNNHNWKYSKDKRSGYHRKGHYHNNGSKRNRGNQDYHHHGNQDRRERGDYRKSSRVNHVTVGDDDYRCSVCNTDNHDESECRFIKAIEHVRSKSKGNYLDSNSISRCYQCSDDEYQKYRFILDSGSTDTHTKYLETLDNVRSIRKPVTTANGEMEISLAEGNINNISGIRFTPGFDQNLLSINNLLKLNYDVIFSNGGSYAQLMKDNRLVNKVPIKHENNLFYVDVRGFKSECDKALVASTKPEDNIMTWHQRLHLSNDLILRLAEKHVKGITIKHKRLAKQLCGRISICEACALARLRKKGHKQKERRKFPSECLAEIDVDLKSVKYGVGNTKYILAFKCAKSKFTWIFFLKTKDQTAEKLKFFKVNVLNQLKEDTNNVKLRIKMIKSDNGGEFMGEFAKLCEDYGIRHEVIPAYSQYLNSYVEGYWRVLMELTRTYLIQGKISDYYWTYACLYANYILNRTTLHAVNGILKTAYEWIYNELPDLSKLKTFGCEVFYHIPAERRDNKALSDWADKGKFLGFSERMVHGVFVLAKNNEVIEENYDFIAFNEVIQLRYDVNTGVSVQLLEEVSDQQNKVMDENGKVQKKKKRVKRLREAVGTRKSARLREKGISRTNNAEGINEVQALDEVQPIINNQAYEILMRYETQRNKKLGLDDANKPLSAEAIGQWMEAIDKEKDSIKVNQVFQLTKRPKDIKVHHTSWVFDIKQDPITLTDLFKKARLVLRGDRTKEGIDYYHTFAPVAKSSSLRMFIASVVELNMTMYQGDVKTAFLNADLEEEIYLEIPSFYRLNEFTDVLDNNNPLKSERPENLCLKLNKALYGLKQAPRNWFENIATYLKELGFQECDSEPCLFYKRQGKDRVMVFLYVDDFIIAATDGHLLAKYRSLVATKYKIKEIGIPKKILGINLIRDGNDIIINQEDKIIKLAEKYKLSTRKDDVRGDKEHRPILTPFDMAVKISKWMTGAKSLRSKYAHMTDEAIEKEYRSLLGTLNHIGVSTRPDIAYAVSILSKYLNRPSIYHLHAAKRIIRYLYTTRSCGIRFRSGGGFNLKTYTDSDWAGEVDERKSHTGVVITLNGAAIHWMSTTQHIITISSAEAEIIALKQGAKDTIWIRNILQELVGVQLPATEIYVDNSASIKIVINPLISKKNRHMEIAYHFIRQHIQAGTLKVVKIDGLLNKADMLTKAMKNYYQDLKSKGLIDLRGMDFEKELKNWIERRDFQQKMKK